jgi:hypothetical protein
VHARSLSPAIESRAVSDLPVEFEELAEVGALRLCRWGPLLVQAWSDHPKMREQEVVEEHTKAMVDELPGGYVSLSLLRIPKLLSSPSAEVRRRAQEQVRVAQHHMIASAVVIDSPGAAGRTARVFVRAVFLVSKVACPWKFFAELDPALDWLAGVEGMPAELVERREALGAALERWWGRREL